MAGTENVLLSGREMQHRVVSHVVQRPCDGYSAHNDRPAAFGASLLRMLAFAWQANKANKKSVLSVGRRRNLLCVFTKCNLDTKNAALMYNQGKVTVCTRPRLLPTKNVTKNNRGKGAKSSMCC